jgi:2'-5' RNA ligase
MRTFVAVDVPDRLADDLAAARAPFADAAGLRLADPEAAHVTLKFIGEVDPGDLDPLADAVGDASRTRTRARSRSNSAGWASSRRLTTSASSGSASGRARAN